MLIRNQVNIPLGLVSGDRVEQTVGDLLVIVEDTLAVCELSVDHKLQED